MEFKLRKSEVGFEYFLKNQINSIFYVIKRDESYSISYEERVTTFARATRLKELYDLFILSLDNNEIGVVEYLKDPTPITHKIMPENYHNYYHAVYEKWIDVFFGNNANELPKINYKTLGRLLWFYRKENELTLSELGEMLELERSTLSIYDKGMRELSADFIYRFCTFLGLVIGSFLNETISKNY